METKYLKIWADWHKERLARELLYKGMETKDKNAKDAQGAENATEVKTGAIEELPTNTTQETTETKKERERNYSLPETFIREMIAKPELNEQFWKIAKEEPEMKVPMLMALAKREVAQLKLKV